MKNDEWVGLLYFVILTQLNTSRAFDESEKPKKGPLVEVRAVYINCESKGSVPADSDSIRFEREELFKHSVLRDCNKKLAVTVKIRSDPEDNSGDEYLPIEHVFEGPDKKRVRLLDPYILRLRREPPLQAYKLRRVDTISGVLLDKSVKSYSISYRNAKGRIERDAEQSESWTSDNQMFHLQTTAVTSQTKHPLQLSTLSYGYENETCPNTFNATLSKRKKRREHNIVIDEASDDSKQWDSKENYYRMSDPVKGVDRNDFDERDINSGIHNSHHRSAMVNHKKETTDLSDIKPQTDEINNSEIKNHLKKVRHFRITHSKEKESKGPRKKNTERSKTSSSSLRTKERKTYNSAAQKRFKEEVNVDDNIIGSAEEIGIDYAVYKIGQPEVWYTVNVQLFEKLSTPEGKTVWNDLTKGEQASVSSKAPEWMGPDLNVRYSPAEWVPREQFSLPSSSLCLLAPVRDAKSPKYSDNNTIEDGIEDGGYMVVPEMDVMGSKDENGMVIINKRNGNETDFGFSPKAEERNNQGHRRVVVRKSSSLLTGNEDKVDIAVVGAEKYLTLPHRHPHHAQIDLEARADENEVIRVGASGRIAIAVADSTRKTRTILTLQVGNTGLAAARFRVKTRDCGPALFQLVNEKNKQFMSAGPVMIPPRHMRSLRLELPVELPIDVVNCSVSLVNDDDKSIAVREVAIKKGDRCFCVWHCDCVCLSDDPRLLCHEMAEARQTAAGLSTHDRTRHARSACYEDVVYINIFIIMFGVIMVLLALGFIKATLGIVNSSIGLWGLDKLVHMPRKIDEYYESNLKNRNVVYDAEGWPVQPDTRERSIRIYGRSMQFVLNVIYFVTVPCMIACERIKMVYPFLCQYKDKAKFTPQTVHKNQTNCEKCYSTQDMQAAMRWRRRHDGLRKWMSPQAQELSKDLWSKSLLPSVKCEFMRPLLHDSRHSEHPEQDQHDPHDPHDPHDRHHLDVPDSCMDSEQDDTDYVITQMQKSRESLSVRLSDTKSV